MQDQKRIEQLLRNATVKVFAHGVLQGTGFFISPTGDLLTAYHCVAQAPNALHVATPFDGDLAATFDPARSLSAYDLALLTTNHRPSAYLPLGRLSADQVGDPVVAVGFPASDLAGNQAIGTYYGTISRWRDDGIVELSDAIKGKGHSGSAVYHYASQRVVGVVAARFMADTLVDVGLARRLEPLFAKWPELADLNQATIQNWERRLQNLHRVATPYPQVLALLPAIAAAPTLLNALRLIFEHAWGCQLLTLHDRSYSEQIFDNARSHLEQAAIIVAEVSQPDPEVMFMLGAARFALGHVPLVLLSQTPGMLPGLLQGRAVLAYQPEAADLVPTLQARLATSAALQQILNAAERQHFLPIARLESLARSLSLPPATWQALQQRYPTREAWQSASPTLLAEVLGGELALANLLLKRIREGLL